MKGITDIPPVRTEGRSSACIKPFPLPKARLPCAACMVVYSFLETRFDKLT